MTPAEVAAKLRQFNEWRRRGRDDIPQPKPCDIGKVIDAAVEMIDRLEAAENDAAHQKALADSALRVAEGWEEKCNALRAKIEAMERQETARLVTPTAYRWRYRGAIKWQYGELTEEGARLAKEHNHEVQPLYAIPGAQPSYLPSDLAEAIIADMQAQYDSELITENDSCEALIRLDGAIAAVEDNFAAATEAKP